MLGVWDFPESLKCLGSWRYPCGLDVHGILEIYFGTLGCTLSPEDVPRIQGMSLGSLECYLVVGLGCPWSSWDVHRVLEGVPDVFRGVWDVLSVFVMLFGF